MDSGRTQPGTSGAPLNSPDSGVEPGPETDHQKYLPESSESRHLSSEKVETPLSEYQIEQSEEISSERESVIPRKCPDWFSHHKSIFKSLSYFEEYFQEEKNQIEFLNGDGACYNRLVIALKSVDEFFNQNVSSPGDEILVKNWLDKSLKHCPLPWRDLPRKLNHLNREWTPGANQWRFFREDNEGKAGQLRKGDFVPKWMNVDILGKNLGTVTLEYWNIRNNNAKDRKTALTSEKLKAINPGMHTWLVAFQKKDLHLDVNLIPQQIDAVKSRLTYADATIKRVKNLKSSQKFCWTDFKEATDAAGSSLTRAPSAAELSPPAPKRARLDLYETGETFTDFSFDSSNDSSTESSDEDYSPNKQRRNSKTAHKKKKSKLPKKKVDNDVINSGVDPKERRKNRHSREKNIQWEDGGMELPVFEREGETSRLIYPIQESELPVFPTDTELKASPTKYESSREIVLSKSDIEKMGLTAVSNKGEVIQFVPALDLLRDRMNVISTLQPCEAIRILEGCMPLFTQLLNILRAIHKDRTDSVSTLAIGAESELARLKNAAKLYIAGVKERDEGGAGYDIDYGWKLSEVLTMPLKFTLACAHEIPVPAIKAEGFNQPESLVLALRKARDLVDGHRTLKAGNGTGYDVSEFDELINQLESTDIPELPLIEKQHPEELSPQEQKLLEQSKYSQLLSIQIELMAYRNALNTTFQNDARRWFDTRYKHLCRLVPELETSI